MQRGYIKLWRKIDEWEWYEDINTSRLFIHLLLKANYTDKNWKGILIKKGRLCTSYKTLSEQTTLTVQEVRTALKKLIKTNEVDCNPTNKYIIITICNYEQYNDNGNDNCNDGNNQTTVNQQSNNNQITTTKKEKKEKEINNKISKEKEKEKEKGKEITLITSYDSKNSEYMECSELLKKRILEVSKAKIDDKKLINWNKQVRLMVMKDGRTVQEIKDTINACHDMPPDKSGFTWKKNILSMATLRHQMNMGRVHPNINKNNNTNNKTKEIISNAVNDVTIKKQDYEVDSMISEMKSFVGNGEDHILWVIANKYTNSEIYQAISLAKEHLENLTREGKNVDKKIKLLRYQLKKKLSK